MAATHHHHHHDVNRHDEHIGSFVLTAEDAIPSGTLDMFLELLCATHGAKLLRIKGIVKLAEMPETPVVVHGVQHVFHPTARLDRWPDDDHRTGSCSSPATCRNAQCASCSRLFWALPPRIAQIAPHSSTIRLFRSGAVSDRRPCLPGRLNHAHAESTSSARAKSRCGETPWIGYGFGTIRRAFPEKSTRRATRHWSRCSRKASKTSDHDACVCMGKTMSYRAVDEASARWPPGCKAGA